MSSHTVTKWSHGTAVHLNLIVFDWSVLCHTPTIENNQLQLGIVTYHVVTGNRTDMNVKFNVRERSCFCVGHSVLFTAEHS